MSDTRPGLDALREALPRAINFRFLPPRLVNDPIWDEIAAELDAALAAFPSTEAGGPHALLETLDEDDVMYDYPVAMSGEPMDPVLFVRWDAIAGRLAAPPSHPTEGQG